VAYVYWDVYTIVFVSWPSDFVGQTMRIRVIIAVLLLLQGKEVVGRDTLQCIPTWELY
jgi:hypothetical protein